MLHADSAAGDRRKASNTWASFGIVQMSWKFEDAVKLMLSWGVSPSVAAQ